jgi:acetate kinase
VSPAQAQGLPPKKWNMRILVINGGSSSFKCAFYEFGSGEPKVVWKQDVLDWPAAGSASEALEPILRRAGNAEAVGHRIVHGGSYHEPARVTADVRSAIASHSEVAPSHNRFELDAIDTVERVLGANVPQVAVFDTAFHSLLEPAAYVYPGPYDWLTGEGIRRYGFHGISYQHASRRVAELMGEAPEKLLACHLGNGASLCSILRGKSVDTTMGFTPLDGLMMGTRSGSVDPGILIYLIRHRGYTAEDLDRILNRESGLLGVSGTSGDMREIRHRISVGDERARLAFDVYMRRLTREAGAMVAVLGGLDALVFTGGVGEHDAHVRQELCSRLEFAGLRVDGALNLGAEGDTEISAAGSQVRAFVVHAEEDAEIARECYRLLR